MHYALSLQALVVVNVSATCVHVCGCHCQHSEHWRGGYCGCFLFQLAYANADRMKDLWCSSTVWLLSPLI